MLCTLDFKGSEFWACKKFFLEHSLECKCTSFISILRAISCGRYMYIWMFVWVSSMRHLTIKI